MPSDPLYFVLFIHVHITDIVLMPRVLVRVSSYANERKHARLRVVNEALQIAFLQPVLSKSQRLVKL